MTPTRARAGTTTGLAIWYRSVSAAAEPTMFQSARRLVRVTVTLAILAAAAVGCVVLWNHYVVGPWTRDAQVQADVVNIAPEVSGRIVALHVIENQRVARGDVLYEIDPFDYQVSLASAEANLQGKTSDLAVKREQAQRRQELTSLTTSPEEKQTYAGTALVAQAEYAAALAQLSQAKVNLERTRVRSPVNGYVTNLLLRVGDYATTGGRNIAVIDSDSYRVTAYFEETKLAGIHPGDRAVAALMGFDAPLRGHVDSIARGISSANYDPGTLGLATVNPVFTWVRLAQRIPVRIAIDEVPAGVLLSAGETATVTVGPWAKPGTAHGWLSRVLSVR